MGERGEEEEKGGGEPALKGVGGRSAVEAVQSVSRWGVLVTSGEWFWMPRVLGGPWAAAGSWVRAGLGAAGSQVQGVPGFVWGSRVGSGPNQPGGGRQGWGLRSDGAVHPSCGRTGRRRA